MKSFFRFVFRALVLLVVALISALTAMRFAIHGREIAVPNLVGKTPIEARRIAEDSGLQFETERQYYSETVPEGRILSQLPEAGARVRRGWQLRVAESLGKQRVEIPNVLGDSQRAAEMNIQRRGLDVASVAQVRLPAATPDNVVSQNPVPNASGVSAPNISLLVAQPAEPQAFVMPSFVGQTLAGATSILQNAGWRVGNVSVAIPSQSATATATVPLVLAPPAPTPASIVVSQTPSAGEKTIAGSTVNFVVR